MVDVTRLAVYGVAISGAERGAMVSNWKLIALATGAAFLGAYCGSLMLPKITLRTLQVVVGVALTIFGAAMAAGLV